MKCKKCKNDFLEKDIHESHDVPCYLFKGNRQGRKNQADKFGRHWLCKYCHETYEKKLGIFLTEKSKWFAKMYFKEDNDGDTKTIN